MKKLLIMAAAALASAFAASAVVVPDYLDRTGWTVEMCSNHPLGTDAGGAAAIIDDDVNTYWHTQWSSPAHGHAGVHFLKFDMSSEQTVDGVSYWRRQGNGNGNWKKFKVYVNNDGFSSITDDDVALAYYNNAANTPAGAVTADITKNDNEVRCQFDAAATGRYMLVIIESYDNNATCGAFWPWKAMEASENYLPAVALKERGDVVAQIVAGDKQTAWNAVAADEVSTQITEQQYNDMKDAFKALVNGTHLKFQSKKANVDWVSLDAAGTAPRRWSGGEDSRVWTLEAADDASGFRILNEYAQQYITFPSQTDQASALTSDKATASLYIIDVWKTTDAAGILYGVKRTASGLASDRQYWHSNQTNALICWQADDNSSWWIEVADDDLAVTQNLKGAIAGCGTSNGRTVGTGLGQYTRTGDFSGELAAANEKLASGTTDEKLAAATALRTAQAACTYALNMPVPGFYRIKSTANSKYISSNTVQGSFSGVATPILAMATGNNNDVKQIWYYDGETLVNWADGRVIGKYESNSGATWNVFVKGDDKAAATITFGENATIGSYTLTAPGNILCADANNLSVPGGSRSDAWTLEAVTWLPVPVDAAIEAGHYIPLCSPMPLYKTAGNYGAGTQRVKAYIGAISDAYVVKSEVEGNQIPANTPVMLEYITGIENGNVFLQVGQVQPQAQAETTNHLSGSVYATEKADTHKYFTVSNSATPQFVAHSDDESVIPGFTAHLAVPTADAQTAYTLVDEVPTAIEAVDAPQVAGAAWYDLQGRRVTRPAHGIFINAQGKKISL